MVKYNVGDRVEYRPITGSAKFVLPSTGEIREVVDKGKLPWYVIRKDNTNEETTYPEMDIMKKI